jgi:hypothetical protein
LYGAGPWALPEAGQAVAALELFIKGEKREDIELRCIFIGGDVRASR